jgi:hypothetical protein
MRFTTKSFLVCAEANTLLRVVSADFFFNCWFMEIPSDNRIRHEPRSIHYHAQGFRLKAFWDFYVGNGGRTPELYYSLSPDWFMYYFMYEKFVACGEF